MSAATATHAKTAAPKEEFFQYTNLGPLLFGLLSVAALGALVCLVGVTFGSPETIRQFLFSWLFAFMFFFTIAAGSLFWVLIHFMMDCEWSVVVRRLLETAAFTGFAGPLAVLFLPIFVKAEAIYEWMGIDITKDPVLAHKHILLNPTVWRVSAVVFFAFFGLVSFLLRRWSCRQDQTGDPGETIKCRTLSFAAIPFFGVFLTFAAIFWLMSIEFEWYSTMWGVYIFAGSAWSSMATLILVTRALHSAGYLRNVVSTEHYHIMGKLLLAFTVFWAYIAFSQYFLIWYANIPEETHYFLVRNTESWNTMTTGLQVAGHFFITFVLLLPRAAKTNRNRLAWIAGWVLFMHLSDLYIVVLPFLHPDGFAPSVFDLASLAAIGGLLAFFFIHTLGRHSLYAARDPRLAESLRLVN